MLEVLAQYRYGFEGSAALKFFMLGTACLCFLAVLQVRMKLNYWILAAMICVAAIGPAANWQNTAFLPNWLLPVQKARSEIFLGLGVALLGLVVLQARGVMVSRMPRQGVLLLIMTVFAGMLRFVHGSPMEGAESVAFAVCTMPALMLAAPAVARSEEGCLKLVRAIMIASVAYTALCVVQFVINPRYLIHDGTQRFLGESVNPTFAAVFTGPMAAVALWLLINEPMRRLRIVWLGMLAVNLLFLTWSGTRGPALSFVFGAVFVLHAKLGRAVLLLPIMGLMVWGLFELSEALHISENLNRLVSTQNTRAAVWGQLLTAAIENPLIGSGVQGNASENSYLLALAAYGMLMGLFMLGLVVMTFALMGRLFISRRLLRPTERPLVDLVMAVNAMFFCGAMFEGYIISRVTAPVTTLLVTSAITVYLLERIAEIRAERDLQSPEDAEFAFGDYHYGDEGQDSRPELEREESRTVVA